MLVIVSLNLRGDQYPCCSTGDVFWRPADEKTEAEHHGSSQVCLWHISDWLYPIAVFLCNEL